MKLKCIGLGALIAGLFVCGQAQSLTAAQQATVDAAVDQLVSAGIVSLPNGVSSAQAHIFGEVLVTAWMDHANYLASLAAQIAGASSAAAVAAQQANRSADAAATAAQNATTAEGLLATVQAALCSGGSITGYQATASAPMAARCAAPAGAAAPTGLMPEVVTLASEAAAIQAQIAAAGSSPTAAQMSALQSSVASLTTQLSTVNANLAAAAKALTPAQ